MGELLVEVRLHVGQLRSDLGFEVLEASRHFLEDLSVSLRAGLPKLTFGLQLVRNSVVSITWRSHQT